MKNTLFLFVISCAFLTLNITRVIAQSDGPRAYSLSPKGILGISQKWTHSSQNIVPAGNIFLLDSDITFDSFPTTVFYNFSIGGKFAQVQFMMNTGSANGTILTGQDEVVKNLEDTGFSDGFAAFRLGLIGAPALSFHEFVKHIPSLSLFGYIRIWYPGSYDYNKILNLGTNRFAIEFGSQLSFPLGKKTKMPIWLESYPYVQFYTKNSEASIIVFGDEIKQKPLFGIENHVSHNFTSRFWASIDLHYKIGGDVEVDGVDQENRIHVLGGGFTFGYNLFSFLKTNVGYGTIIFGEKGIQANTFRVGLVFLHKNKK